MTTGGKPRARGQRAGAAKERPQRRLDAALATRFAAILLSHLAREYPNKLDHVLRGPADARGPRALHPAFYGSFDWHSSVHSHWAAARLYRGFPRLKLRAELCRHLDAHLCPDAIGGELRYLERAGPTFERPYGWAWLLALHAELTRHRSEEGRRWRAALEPLAAAFAERSRSFLPKAMYPVRVGTHFNSAFALTLTLDYARAVRDRGLRRLIEEKARLWYGRDAGCQAWEPGGDDFLSPALVEAECMRRVLPAAEFEEWFRRFLPRLASRQPRTLFIPAEVSDRSDGKTVHLDGLSLSRAWCWRSLAGALEAGDPRRALALDAAETHLDAALPHLAGDYMGEHWLVSFAVLALLT